MYIYNYIYICIYRDIFYNELTGNVTRMLGTRGNQPQMAHLVICFCDNDYLFSLLAGNLNNYVNVAVGLDDRHDILI